jgi:hypothetical protein
MLPAEILEQVFRGQTSAKTVPLRFWPLVTARKSSHGAARAGGLPEIVAPVVTEATVDRDGQITPMRNALARDLLTPLPSGEFAIGPVDALGTFLTATPLPDMSGTNACEDYLGHSAGWWMPFRRVGHVGTPTISRSVPVHGIGRGCERNSARIPRPL